MIWANRSLRIVPKVMKFFFRADVPKVLKRSGISYFELNLSRISPFRFYKLKPSSEPCTSSDTPLSKNVLQFSKVNCFLESTGFSIVVGVEFEATNIN